MGKLGQAVKKICRLEEKVGNSETYKQAKAIGWLDDYFILNKVAYQQIGRQLSKLSREVDMPAKEVPSSEFDTIKAYHTDVIEAFKEKIGCEPKLLMKYRKGELS